MDFSFTDVQDDVRVLSRDVLDAMASPERVRDVERTDDAIDRELWAELARSELLGVALPEDVGGSGHGIMELGVLLEEIGRRVAPVPVTSTVGFAGLPIAAFATDEERKARLVPILEGSSFLTAALEEVAGHDPLVVSTSAVRDGSHWRVTGKKVTVPHAPLADRILVTARSEHGPVVLLLDPSARGVTLEPTRSTHRQLQANLTLDDVVVSEDETLGDPSKGAEVLRYTYRHAVACLCATAVGVLEEALRITARYISEREQFGKPIATFQAATLKAADAYIDTEAVRATTWSAIWRLAEDRAVDDELAIAKYWVCDAGQRVVHACQHLHGGIGVDVDYPIHRYFLWAKHLELALGGAHSQLLRIGASIASD